MYQSATGVLVGGVTTLSDVQPDARSPWADAAALYRSFVALTYITRQAGGR